MASAASGNTLRQIDRLFGAGTVAGLSDQQLLERFAATRDEAAFAALVERHGPMVLGVCRAVLKDEHDAEDAFQATFLVLARKAGVDPRPARRSAAGSTGWPTASPSRPASRPTRRRGRERKAMARSAVRADGVEHLGRLAAGPARGDRPAARAAPRRRRPLLPRGLTYEQAAPELRWTVPTLRCRLARARERLRGRLIRRGRRGAGAALAASASTRAPASAAVPAAWAAAAVAAATGGATISATAAALAASGPRRP